MVDVDRRVRALAPTGVVDPDGLERARARVRAEQDTHAGAVPTLAAARARRAGRPARRWALAAGGAAAAVVAAVLLTAPPDEPAFATWTAIPAAPDPATAARATASCASSVPADVQPAPVLVEQRGAVVLSVLADGAWASACVWSDHETSEGSIAAYTRTMPAAPTADGVAVVSWVGTWSPEDGPWTAVYGLAGSDVAQVVVDREAGGPVRATVQDGWFAAWWPTDSPAATVTPFDERGVPGAPVEVAR
ncbi:hypothetical protein Cma02nite_23910 [Cellulomonas marina]|nr:hypothetical protein Cma02nite_23910 [Cellulomonas marina]